ncbi:hypothetical protein [Vibrio sp.]|uniref:hypothetical protein n=1 Tax=Vibrio sp. TaxID=678 RepID=UPI003AA7CD52
MKVDLPIVGSAEKVLTTMLGLLAEQEGANDEEAIKRGGKTFKYGAIVSAYPMKPLQRLLSLSKLLKLCTN